MVINFLRVFILVAVGVFYFLQTIVFFDFGVVFVRSCFLPVFVDTKVWAGFKSVTDSLSPNFYRFCVKKSSKNDLT
jgi:hypothetical protein